MNLQSFSKLFCFGQIVCLKKTCFSLAKNLVVLKMYYELCEYANQTLMTIDIGVRQSRLDKFGELKNYSKF